MVCIEEEGWASASLIPGHARELVTEYFANVDFGQINSGFTAPSHISVMGSSLVTGVVLLVDVEVKDN